MLTRLIIDGFRGMRKTISLSQTTTIEGGNGKGKTTILDAIRWCLTGTDGQGLQNNNIFNNRRTGGKKEAISVECVFMDDGVETAFVRTAVLQGEDATYSYRFGSVDVPAKKYIQCVEDYLAPMQLLKFALNVRLWDSLTEGDLRKVLMLVFNEKEMMCDGAYREIVSLAETTGLDNVKKQLRKNIREGEKALDIIALELDMKEQSLPDAVSESTLEDMLAEKERLLAEEEDKGSSISTEKALRMRERAQAIVDAETDYANAESAYRVSSISKISELETLLIGARYAAHTREKTREDIALSEEKLSAAQSEMQDLKKRYDEESAATFDGTCPTCGRLYESEDRELAAKRFIEEKKERMAKTVASAKTVRDRIDKIKAEIEEKKSRLNAQNDTAKKISDLENELDKAKAMSAIKFEDTAEGIRLRERIDEARKANAEWESAEVDYVSVLRAEVVELKQKCADAKRISDERYKILGEIADIKRRQNDAVKNKMNDERLLALAKNYEVAVCQGLEDYVNSIIEGDDVSVSLYKVDEDGEAKPQCKVISNGVTDTLNNALRNTVGIRLAESVMPKFAHQCPILIDNCEAFDNSNVPQSKCQLVLAKVDNEGKELKIK